MATPWFDPNVFAWLPGTALGVALGVWGGVVGLLAPRARGRRVVISVTWLLAAASVALLVAGLAGLAAGQPYGVWYGLLLPGLIGSTLTPGLLIALRPAYRSAEERRMQVRDIFP